jgi:hypothetical protein
LECLNKKKPFGKEMEERLSVIPSKGNDDRNEGGVDCGGKMALVPVKIKCSLDKKKKIKNKNNIQTMRFSRIIMSLC